MISVQDLTKAFERNVRIAQQQTEGLSHADCLLQLPFQGNCMNWTLGHVADTRNRVLGLLGLEKPLSEAQCKRYGYGSDPVCADGDDVMSLEALIDMLTKSQPAIAARLLQITPQELAVEMDSYAGKTTLGGVLFLQCLHERHHLGQTELLRELALGQKA